MNPIKRLFPQICVILLFYFSDNVANCANILVYHNMGSYSHRVPTYELALALAKRGHQVTMISPFQPREPIERHQNLTDIAPKGSEKLVASFLESDFDINLRVEKKFPRLVGQFFAPSLVVCEDFLQSPELKEYLSKTKSLDLVIMDNCISECVVPIAYKYNAKHIYLNTVTYIGSEFDFYGMYAPEAGAIPEMEIDPPKPPMAFFEKVFNALISIHYRYNHYNYMKVLDGMVRKYMSGLEEMPFLDDVARNHSLVFYTGDIVTDYPRIQPPNVVNVAGIHCKKGTGALPQDMLNFINNSTGNVKNEGFVYFSLGSLAASSLLPDHIKQALLDTVGSFPQLKFLWKWNGPLPEKYPENIYFAKWFPQQEVLSHPKIKAFVTQSGRPSTIEGVFNGVPMIAFPVLGDQDLIADRMEAVGGSIKLELGTLTEEEFTNAMNTVVYDERMRERAKDLQRIFNDRRETPVETAVWWTEYVLRHKDLSHLRPAGFQQTWWQRRLLDVWAFLYTLVLFTLITVFYVGRAIFRTVNASTKNGEVKAKRE